MYRDTAENLMIAADNAAELAAAIEQENTDRFMDNIASIDEMFARIDPIMQTKLDFCTCLEVLCNIPVRY